MTTKRRKHRNSPIPLLLLIAGIVVAWILYGVIVFFAPFEGEFWDTRGKFGDMFGAFNALFTACAFAAVLFEIRLEYKAVRRQELHSALSAQVDTLVQILAMPAKQRTSVWTAIVAAHGASNESYTIEAAIAMQIDYMERLMAGEEMDFVPTYGRSPNT